MPSNHSKTIQKPIKTIQKPIKNLSNHSKPYIYYYYYYYNPY